jgi:serine protease Do
MRPWQSVRVIIFVIMIMNCGFVNAEGMPSTYQQAEIVFKTSFNPKQRILFQIMLTSAGYWNAISNETFGKRLFNAIQRFQQENGFAADGILNAQQFDRLTELSEPKLRSWRFRKIKHPERMQQIWIPTGLGLQAVRNANGINYSEPQKRIAVSFLTFEYLRTSDFFANTLNTLVEKNAVIRYKTIKQNWFVISASTPDGIDHYYRFHQDGTNVTGFMLFWQNSNGNVSGERIATLMSASISADVLGTAFIDPPNFENKTSVSRSEPSTAIVPQQPKPPETTEPKVFSNSSGTGFFVNKDGSLVTNAHVVDGCKTITIKPDIGQSVDAKIIAVDKINDLAVLKAEFSPTKTASIKMSTRLGESIAIFGFPLTNTLASTGNFTLGNVTALAGLGDDTRSLQVSAPVQPGNSGGPVIDYNGNLVGVATSKLDAIKSWAKNGDLPQNVNFAVKSSAVAMFLESNRVTFEIGTATNIMSPPDLAEHAKSFSAYIACKN